MSSSQKSSASKAELLELFDSLEPWTDPAGLDNAAWSQYIKAARQVQQTEPVVVEQALDLYVAESERAQAFPDENQSRVFLLLRIVFALPHNAPESQRRSFKGWINWPQADANGQVNLSWPIVWDETGPRLEARYEGSEGRPYAAGLEYRYFRDNYPYRELSTGSGQSDSSSSE